MKDYYVYIMASKKHGTLYTGVTSNLLNRVYQHKHHTFSGFTARYSIHLLVYFEVTNDIRNAIEREKRIKGQSRNKKIELIESLNPEWKDLSVEWFMDSSLRSE
ncbi:MAG: GIY-YIG nuclease family protein [Chloroflexota bacterium]